MAYVHSSLNMFSARGSDIFTTCDSGERYPASGTNEKVSCFRFCGKLIALAMRLEVRIGVRFAVAFYKQLAGHQVSFQDIGQLDPVIHRSWSRILMMNEEEISSVAAIGISSEDEEEELIIANRYQKLESYIKRRFVIPVEQQVLSFVEGFVHMMARGDIERFLMLLDAEEVNDILGGCGDVDCNDWKQGTLYSDGYTFCDNQIIWFWQVMEEMTTTQRRGLLHFVTSLSAPPSRGFGALHPNFCIAMSPQNVSSLPTSSTCINQLNLPKYETLEMMRDKLIIITKLYVAHSFGDI